MRTIKAIHPAVYDPIADLITYRPLPGPTIRDLDPFIFLNHHGHQVYPKNNNGLPFGPHPHRGMETVTFILEGDIMHKDSENHESVIASGGIQWMTAGRGLIHAEVSSSNFKKEGGPLEILQLWLNLPSWLKMTDPRYIGLQEDEIHKIQLPEKAGHLQLIAGEWEGQKGSFETLTPIFLSTIFLNQGGKFKKEIAKDENIFFYIVRGEVKILGERIPKRNLVEFHADSDEIQFEATEDSVVILGHAKPFGEPIIAQGPFVMNSQEEIRQAYRDYQAGKFGNWKN